MDAFKSFTADDAVPGAAPAAAAPAAAAPAAAAPATPAAAPAPTAKLAPGARAVLSPAALAPMSTVRTVEEEEGDCRHPGEWPIVGVACGRAARRQPRDCVAVRQEAGGRGGAEPGRPAGVGARRAHRGAGRAGGRRLGSAQEGAPLRHPSLFLPAHASAVGRRLRRALSTASLSFVACWLVVWCAQGAAPAAAAAAPAAAGASLIADALAAYTDIPHTQIRRVTAQRLLESKQTIPHYYLTVEVQVRAHGVGTSAPCVLLGKEQMRAGGRARRAWTPGGPLHLARDRTGQERSLWPP